MPTQEQRLKSFVEHAVHALAEEDRRLQPVRDMYALRYNAAPKTTGGVPYVKVDDVANEAIIGQRPLSPSEYEHMQKSSDRPGATGTEDGTLYSAVDNAAATLVPRKMDVTISTPIQAQKRAAHFRTKLLQLLFKETNLTSKLRNALVNTIIAGRGCVKIAWNTNSNGIIAKSLKPKEVYWDPEAASIDEVTWVLQFEAMHRDVFMSRIAQTDKPEPNQYPKGSEKRVKWSKSPEWLGESLFSGQSSLSGSPTSGFSGITKPAATLSPEEESKQEGNWVVLVEFWDLIGNKWYHYLPSSVDSGDGIILLESALPYSGLKCPFYFFTFNDNLRNTHGLSDALLAMPSMKRSIEMNSQRSQHADASIPLTVANAAHFTDPVLAAQRFAEGKKKGASVVMLPMRGDVPAAQAFSTTYSPTLTPDFERAIRNSDTVTNSILAMPGYARGQSDGTDVATKLALMDSALATREDLRSGIIYDTVQELCHGALALYAEFMAEATDATDDDAIVVVDTSGPRGQHALVMLTRELLGFRPPIKDRLKYMPGRLPKADKLIFTFDISTHPAQDKNPGVTIKMLQLGLPLLQGNPAVDQSALVRMFLDAMGWVALYKDPSDATTTPGGPTEPPAFAVDPNTVPAIGGLNPGAPEVQAGQVTDASIAQETSNPGGLV